MAKKKAARKKVRSRRTAGSVEAKVALVKTPGRRKKTAKKKTTTRQPKPKASPKKTELKPMDHAATALAKADRVWLVQSHTFDTGDAWRTTLTQHWGEPRRERADRRCLRRSVRDGVPRIASPRRKG